MMNEITLVPNEEIRETLPPLRTKSSPTKEQPVIIADKKLPAGQKDIPVNKWIMPPEQQGYIQGSDKDCL